MKSARVFQVLFGVALAVALGPGITFPCVAQNLAVQPGSQKPQQNDFGNLPKGQSQLGEYMKSSRGSGQSGAAILDAVAASGLARNSANVASLRQALASNTSVEEKIGLVRLLGRQYSPDNVTGANESIVADLKNAANSSDAGLARAAVLAFSRLGYPPGFEEVLASSRTRGIIDDNTYFGELAHVLPFAPASDQQRFAQMLGNSGNDYAAQIVAMLVNSGWALGSLSDQSRKSIANFLDRSEPEFAKAIGQFDFLDAVRYSAWLRATATLRASDFNKQGAELIMGKLSDPRTDPRKIMAFLVSEFGPPLVAQIASKERFSPLLQRIDLYSRQNPQNSDIREIVSQVSAMLS